jgi:hypothetical protein
MPLLKEYYPEAKFIHIFRDPRDYCLSGKKSYGKNIYRAAEDWRRCIKSATDDASLIAQDYMQISYESLLMESETVLRHICKFINVEFIQSMLTPLSTTENLGDAKGQAIIIRGNLGKYKEQLSSSQVNRIEEIVKPVALNLGYEIGENVRFKPVNAKLLNFLAACDGWTSVKFHVAEYGFLKGLRRLFHWHSRGSWLAHRWKAMRPHWFIAKRLWYTNVSNPNE